jgi:hypothetical protein
MGHMIHASGYSRGAVVLDFKYGFAVVPLTHFYELWKLQPSPILKPACDVYAAHLGTLRSLWFIMPEVIVATWHHMQLQSQACLRILGRPNLTNRDMTNLSLLKAIEVEMASINRRETTEQVKLMLECPPSDPMTPFKDDLRIGLVMLHEITTRADQSIAEGMRSLFVSQLLQAWTAFETLIENLWKAVASQFPNALPKPAAKYRFRSREKFRIAYLDLFGANGQVNSIINDRRIDRLSVLRNLIVHTGSVVDQTFIDDCSIANISEWNGLKLGQRVPIDGATVANLVHPVVKLGIDLLREADTWITAKCKSRGTEAGTDG